MPMCILPCIPIFPMRIFFFTKNSANITAGTTVNIMNTATANSITISFANSSITVRKRNAIFKGIIIIRTGAATGHIIIFIGKHISLKRPILLPRFDFITFRRLKLSDSAHCNPRDTQTLNLARA
ncbi:MAG: hypothetical protein WCB79_02825 [Halobacteriota archaeon]